MGWNLVNKGADPTQAMHCHHKVEPKSRRLTIEVIRRCVANSIAIAYKIPFKIVIVICVTIDQY